MLLVGASALLSGAGLLMARRCFVASSAPSALGRRFIPGRLLLRATPRFGASVVVRVVGSAAPWVVLLFRLGPSLRSLLFRLGPSLTALLFRFGTSSPPLLDRTRVDIL